jgi:hypothetical protein
LNSVKANIFRRFAAGVIIFLLITPFLLFAQPDSIVQLHQSKFARNMLELGDLYCFSDPTFQPGKVKFATVQNVAEKYRELNLGLFPKYQTKPPVTISF